MLNEICSMINNFFSWDDDRFIGDFSISDGIISPSIDLSSCDYIRIIGSHKNDGIHKVSEMNLKNDTFHGGIWRMYPPDDFLALVSEIEAWQAENGGADSHAMSPFNSESIGVYSYSKNNTTGSNGWLSAYGSRLRGYRRIRKL